MKRHLGLFTLLAFTLLASSGCSLCRGIGFARGAKALTIHTDKIVFKGYDDGAFHFDFPVRLENQSRGEVTVRRLDLNASINNGQLFSSHYDESLKIAPESQYELTLPIAVRPLGGAMGMISHSPVFRFDGLARVDMGSLGELDIPFGTEREIFSPDRARLKFNRISLGKSTLTELRLVLLFDRVKVPKEKVEWSRFSGTVELNGMEVGTFDERNMSPDRDRVDIEICIPTFRAARVIRMLKDAEQVGVKVDTLYESESKNMLYRIPYTFESSTLGGL